MLQWFSKRINELHKEDRKGEKGFTLIELLVVVIIIGILAAIAIPVFLSQRQNANTAACRSDVRNGAAAAQAYAADNAGSYAGMTAAILQAATTATPPGYDWNISSPPSSNPQVTGPGGTGLPTAAAFQISVSCANADAATYTFDSGTGQVTP